MNRGFDLLSAFRPGDPCLPALAQFPPPFPKMRGYARLARGGATTTTLYPQIMVWFINRPKGTALVTCEADGNGGLIKVKTYLGGALGDEISTASSEQCGLTLAELTAKGGTVHGPVPANLGFDSTGTPIGGLTFMMTNKSEKIIELVDCNQDASGDQLLVTSRETSKEGVDDSAVGSSCLATLDASMAAGRAFSSGPVAKSTNGNRSGYIPASLIFDFNAGGVGR